MSDDANITLKEVASPDRKVLVVDDDLETSRVISQMLTHLGYRTVTCSHAHMALDHIQSRPFDLILIDYQMPEMTGLDLISMLRQDGCNIPVIMMTGHFGATDRISAQELKELPILKKPVSISELAKAMEDSLKGVTR